MPCMRCAECGRRTDRCRCETHNCVGCGTQLRVAVRDMLCGFCRVELAEAKRDDDAGRGRAA